MAEQNEVRDHSKKIVQAAHETTYASTENKHFFTIQARRQTYQNYQQSRQKLGTFLKNLSLKKIY